MEQMQTNAPAGAGEYSDGGPLTGGVGTERAAAGLIAGSPGAAAGGSPGPNEEDAAGPRGGQEDAAGADDARGAEDVPGAEEDPGAQKAPDPPAAAVLLARLLAARAAAERAAESAAESAAEGAAAGPAAGPAGRFASSPAQEAVMRELEGYRQRERERLFTDDLAQIRAAHPEESARSVSELGPQYLAICAAGVDPLCAYEAVRSHRDRTAPPPSTGAFGGKPPAREFFTRDEVAQMSRSEIHRNFDKIRRSMSHWNF